MTSLAHTQQSQRPQRHAVRASRAMVLPTVLMLIATALIAKIALAGPEPMVLPPSPTVPAVVIAPTEAVPEPTQRPSIVHVTVPMPPLCETATAGEACLSSLPECDEVTLSTPGIICQWPRDPAWPPH
jgi:hypothetical protein